jgi:hypothetical protein
MGCNSACLDRGLALLLDLDPGLGLRAISARLAYECAGPEAFGGLTDGICRFVEEDAQADGRGVRSLGDEVSTEGGGLGETDVSLLELTPSAEEDGPDKV